MGKYAPVHEQVQIAIGRTREQVRLNTIAYAKAENDRIMNASPRPSGETITVDGIVGASIDSVKIGGEIDFKYWRGDDIAQFALQTLRDLSPVGSDRDPHPGLYRDSHILYLNGNPVADGSDWKPGDDFYIMNLVPYARKIEVGFYVMHVPGTDHVYQQAQQLVNNELRSRGGNFGSVTFEMRSGGDAGATLAGVFSKGVGPSARTGIRKDTAAGASLTYPALVLSE